MASDGIRVTTRIVAGDTMRGGARALPGNPKSGQAECPGRRTIAVHDDDPCDTPVAQTGQCNGIIPR